jgi:hypothetical protein
MLCLFLFEVLYLTSYNFQKIIWSVTGSGLWASDRGSIAGRDTDPFLRHHIETGSGTHTTSAPGTRSQGAKLTPLTSIYG